MTQAVPVEGFNVPPAGNTTATPPAQELPPPQAPAPAPPAGGSALESSIAALTAALAAQNAQAAQASSAAVADIDINGIDDPIIRSMATVFKTVGKDLDLDRAIGKAMADGRPDLIDVAYLREKGGANSEALIDIAKGLIQAVEAKSTAITASIHSLAGGEANWSAGVASFNATAPLELRMAVAQMLDSKKESMIQAGAKLVVEFSKGALPNINPGVQTGAATLPAAQALDKVTFQEELFKLDPNSRTFERDRESLFARRKLGQQLGK